MITEETGYDIRYSELEDEKFVIEWLKDPEVRKWFPPTEEKEIDPFVRNWVGFSRHKSSLTAVYQGKPVGIVTLFLMPYIKVAHLCMVYIAVDPAMQRQGVGYSLVKNIKHLAKNYFKLESVHAEVFEGCPAEPLLEKHDFKTVVRQDNFVKLDEGYRQRLIMEVDLS